VDRHAPAAGRASCMGRRATSVTALAGPDSRSRAAAPGLAADRARVARRKTMSRRCGSGTVPVACGADQYGPARAPNNQWLLFHLASQGRPSSGRCCHWSSRRVVRRARAPATRGHPRTGWRCGARGSPAAATARGITAVSPPAARAAGCTLAAGRPAAPRGSHR